MSTTTELSALVAWKRTRGHLLAAIAAAPDDTARGLLRRALVELELWRVRTGTRAPWPGAAHTSRSAAAASPAPAQPASPVLVAVVVVLAVPGLGVVLTACAAVLGL